MILPNESSKGCMTKTIRDRCKDAPEDPGYICHHLVYPREQNSTKVPALAQPRLRCPGTFTTPQQRASVKLGYDGRPGGRHLRMARPTIYSASARPGGIGPYHRDPHQDVLRM